MSRFDSFLIFINNLSYVYIFTTIAVIISIFLACCAKVVNIVPKNKRFAENSTVDTDGNNDDGDEIVQQNVTNGLLSQIKLAKYKEIEKGLSKDEIEQERNVEREQLAAIFKLLKAQEIEFNTTELDENQMKSQLKLYR